MNLIFILFLIIKIVSANNDDNIESVTTLSPITTTTTTIYNDTNGRSFDYLQQQGRIINDEKLSIKGFIPIVGLSSSSSNNENSKNIERNINIDINNKPSSSENTNIYDDQLLSNINLPQYQINNPSDDQRNSFISTTLQNLIGANTNNNNNYPKKYIDCICVPFYMCRNGIIVNSIIDPYNNLFQQTRKNDYHQQQQHHLQIDDIDIYSAINERSLDHNNNNTNKYSEEILGRMIGSLTGNSLVKRQMSDKCGLLRTCCQKPYNYNPIEQQLNNDYIGANIVPPSSSYGGQFQQSTIYRPQSFPSQFQENINYNPHHQNRPLSSIYNPRPMPTYHRPPKVLNPLYSNEQSFNHHHQTTSLPIPIRNDHFIKTNNHHNMMNQAYNNCGQRQSIGINGRVQNLQYHHSSTEFAEFPWQVAILKKIGPSDNLYVCGGALISSKFIITAAHCIKKFQANDLKIRLGEWDVHREDEFYPYVEKNVDEILIHPNFVPRNLVNDVAILKLDSEIDFNQNPHISSICMTQSYRPFIGKRCFVAGWGKNSFGQQGEYQSVLMKVDLPVLEQRQCERQLKQTKLGYNFHLDRSMICAGGEIGKDACEGDGGSGLVCESTNGIWNIIGLVSWGLGCGQNGVPGVYTNIEYVRNWIDSIILPYYNNHNHHHHHNMISKPLVNFNELINERSLSNVNNNQNNTESLQSKQILNNTTQINNTQIQNKTNDSN